MSLLTTNFYTTQIVSCCVAFARAANGGQRASNHLPIGTIDQCIAKVQSYKKAFSMAPFAVLVKVVNAPSKDGWTRSACADPYNRQCSAWLVCASVFLLLLLLFAMKSNTVLSLSVLLVTENMTTNTYVFTV